MGYFVPETLKHRPQWVVQRGKVPYMADGRGRKASTTDPATWADYDTAAAALQYGDFDGLGYVFTASDGLVFVDIDHAIDSETGEYSQFSQEVLDMFPGSYAEISQSGTGLHIVCMGSLPRAVKRKEIEMYSAGRYMAFTGQALEFAEPQEAQASIDELFERFAPKSAENKLQQAQISVESCEKMTDAGVVLARAERSRVSAEFVQLYAGQWQGRYRSQSEADLRLMWLLWFFSDGDKATAFALFMESGLGKREKARRADYLERTWNAVQKNSPRKPRMSRTGVSRLDTGKYQGSAQEAPQGPKKATTRKGYRRFFEINK